MSEKTLYERLGGYEDRGEDDVAREKQLLVD